MKEKFYFIHQFSMFLFQLEIIEQMNFSKTDENFFFIEMNVKRFLSTIKKKKRNKIKTICSVLSPFL